MHRFLISPGHIVEHVNLKIDGMTCGHCVAAVQHALGSLEGVRAEAVGVGTANVSFDASRSSSDAIVRAVSDAGYPARLAT